MHKLHITSLTNQGFSHLIQNKNPWQHEPGRGLSRKGGRASSTGHLKGTGGSQQIMERSPLENLAWVTLKISEQEVCHTETQP